MMKYKIIHTCKFMKDLKTIKRRGYDLFLLSKVVDTLTAGELLPPKNKDHKLKGNFSNCRECHITPDWLLIYEIVEEELYLYLTRAGIHSDLF